MPQSMTSQELIALRKWAIQQASADEKITNVQQPTPASAIVITRATAYENYCKA